MPDFPAGAIALSTKPRYAARRERMLIFASVATERPYTVVEEHLSKLRSNVRYARGATLIIYEFLTEPGREEDRAAQVHASVQDILAELTAPH